MSTSQNTIDYLLDLLLTSGAPVSARKMFGEYCLYCNGKPVALVCDDQLFLKPTAAGRALLAAVGDVVEAPPYPGARLHFLVSADLLENHAWLGSLIRATDQALPAPKPKAKAKPKARPAPAGGSGAKK